MKILYCHNYYRHRGGEDVSFQTDVEMLRSRGHSVFTFTRDNEDMQGNQLRMAANAIWNRSCGRELAQMIVDERPDIVHCNNLFPQISVSVYKAAHRHGVPVVQALRNYRPLCANSFLYRNKSLCTKCIGGAASWRSMIHGCYRESRLASAVVVAMQVSQSLAQTHKRYIDAFFTPSEFARSVYIQAGYDPDRIHVRTNFMLPDLGATADKSGPAMFVGRLSDEKGVDTVIDAWNKYQIQIPLQIIGEGPESESLRIRAQGNRSIEFMGAVPNRDVLTALGRAQFLVMPSRWYETFGRTIAEAFSRGTPVVGSDLGAMAELIKDGVNGYLFAPSDPDHLGRQVRRFLSLSASDRTAMSQAARETYTQRFTAQTSYKQLLGIYESAKSHFASRSLSQRKGKK